MTFRHRLKVRYGEVDLQGVVFNAHYLAYVDDTIDTWFREALGPSFQEHDWDVMLKKAVVEWSSPAGLGDTLDLDARIDRWGNTSLDVRVDGAVDGRPVFTAVITYVGVHYGTHTPRPAPDAVRSALGAVVE
jgi:acyl-CoA thioester hydrolase